MFLRITRIALVVPMVLWGATTGRGGEPMHATPLTDPRPYMDRNEERPFVSPPFGAPRSSVLNHLPSRVARALTGATGNQPAKPQPLAVPDNGSTPPLKAEGMRRPPAPVPLTDPDLAETLSGPVITPPAGAETQSVDASPVLSVETLGPSEINVGRSGLYTITVRNLGKTLAEGVRVRTMIPPHAELKRTQPQPASRGDGELAFDIGTIPAESVREVQLELAPLQAHPIDLATSVSFSVSSRAVTQVRRPQLRVICDVPPSADFGDPLVFRLTVSNTGDGACDDVTLTPEFPPEAVQPKHPVEPASVGWLRPGESRELTFTATAIGRGALDARFTAATASGIKATAESHIIVRRPMLAVAARGPRVNYLNRESVYEIQLSNPGDSVAQNVKVVNTLPRGLSLTVADRDADFSTDANTVTWVLPTLRPGATERLTFKARAGSEGDLVQQVSATAAGNLRADARHETKIITRATINVAVLNRDGPLELNETATFEVAMKNVGAREASHVMVKVRMPEGLRPANDSELTAGPAGLMFPTFALAAGEERRLTLHAVGQKAGDRVLRIVLESDALTQPLIAEGNAFFYDGHEPRVSAKPAAPVAEPPMWR